MLRGLVGEEIEITCADHDLHSGHVRQRRAQPQPGAGRDHRQPPQPRRQRRRRRASTTTSTRSPPSVAAQLEDARLRRGGVPRRRRPHDPGRREEPLGAGADLVAPDLRDQRHDRRLHRRRLQDRDPGQGQRQDLVPPGVAAWTPTRSATPSARTSAPASRPIAASTFNEHGGSPAITVPSDGAIPAQGARGADRRMGQGGRDRSAPAARSRWPATSSATSGSTRCSSALPTTTTASTRPTRSTTSRASTAASAPGSASSRRSPTALG